MRGDNVASKDSERATIYSKKIAPNLDIIRSMAAAGVTQVKMREALGISRRTWEKERATRPEFAEALRPQEQAPQRPDRAKEVKALEESMQKLAHGYTRMQTRFINTKNGLEEVEEEIYYPPNFNALRFLLLNWGGYMSEPAAQAQREKEFEHKKEMDERENW